MYNILIIIIKINYYHLLSHHLLSQPKPIAALVTTIGDLRMLMHLAIFKVQRQVQKLNCRTTKLFKQIKLESSIFQQTNFLQKE